MRRIVAISVFVSMVTALLVASPSLADSGGRGGGGLDAYSASVTPDQLGELARLGHDVAGAEGRRQRRRPSTSCSARRSATTWSRGASTPQLKKVNGKTLKQLAAEQAVERLHGVAVLRRAGRHPRPDVRASRPTNPRDRQAGQARHDDPGPRDPRDQAHPGRPRTQRTAARPAVLYSATQHAREWIATEVDRRLHDTGTSTSGAPTTRDVTKLLAARTELWFMPVANPDGYQYTFDHRAAVAQEPARQRRRRPDHRRRRRRPEPQLPEPLGLRQRGLVLASRRATPTAGRRPASEAGDARR